jgi:hypothetical protein
MKLRAVLALITVVALLAVPAVIAAVNTYQVTGPVLEVTNDKIVVQKGKDRWELARDGSTKVNGDLKVGAKVTIEYRMTATTVDVKAETAAPAAKKKPAAKKP